MKLLTLSALILSLINKVQATSMSNALLQRRTSPASTTPSSSVTSPSLISCSIKGGSEAIIESGGEQTLLCRYTKPIPKGQSIIVTPESKELIFEKCKMTFSSDQIEQEVKVYPKSSTCQQGAKSEYSVQLSYESSSKDLLQNSKKDVLKFKRVCVGLGTCTVSGDPHIKQFNSEHALDFMGKGAYMLVDASEIGLRVVGTYIVCGKDGHGNPLTCLGGMSVQYGDSGLVYTMVDPKKNDQKIAKPELRKMDGYSGKGITYSTKNAVTKIQIEDGSSIVITKFKTTMDATIMLSGRYHKKTKGHCNNWGLEKGKNVLVKKDGSFINLSEGNRQKRVDEWAESWKVSDQENPFYGNKVTLKVQFYGDRECKTESTPTPPPSPTIPIYDPCNAIVGKCGERVSTTLVPTGTLTSTTRNSESSKTPDTYPEVSQSSVAPTARTTTRSISKQATSTKSSGASSSVVPKESPTVVQTTKVTSPLYPTVTAQPPTRPTSKTTPPYPMTTETPSKSTSTSTDIYAVMTNSQALQATSTSCTTSTKAQTSTTNPTPDTTTAVEEEEQGEEVNETLARETNIYEFPANSHDNLSESPQEPKVCPDSFKIEAEKQCKEILDSVQGCDKVCPKVHSAKLESCVNDAIRLCNYEFVESHKLHYLAACELKTSVMSQSDDPKVVSEAQSVRQENGFGEYAFKENQECGDHGNPSDIGCVCDDGYSGPKCTKNLLALPAYDVAELYDPTGQPLRTALTSNLLAAPSTGTSTTRNGSTNHGQSNLVGRFTGMLMVISLLFLKFSCL